MTLHVPTASRFPVLMVTGLAKEMRLAEGPGLVAIASGGDTGRLRRRLAERIVPGCRAVLSFGIAGGLDPSLSRRGRGRGDRRSSPTDSAGRRIRRSPISSRRRSRPAASACKRADIAGVDAPLLDAVGQGGDAARDRRRGGRHGIACRLRVRGAARADVRGASDHLRSGGARPAADASPMR